MKYIEAKGETIDAAVESALLQLGMTRDDVSVEVLQQPKSGFLGFGKEPAIVRVSYEVTPTGRAVDFLKGLLPRSIDTADLMIVFLLLLMNKDDEGGLSPVLTLALYFLL